MKSARIAPCETVYTQVIILFYENILQAENSIKYSKNVYKTSVFRQVAILLNFGFKDRFGI